MAEWQRLLPRSHCNARSCLISWRNSSPSIKSIGSRFKDKIYYRKNPRHFQRLAKVVIGRYYDFFYAPFKPLLFICVSMYAFLISDDGSELLPLLGIVTATQQKIYSVGTAIEIRSYQSNILDNGVEELLITAKGRRRFRIKRIQRQLTSITYAHVEFYSESFAGNEHCGIRGRKVQTMPFPGWVYRAVNPRHLAGRALKAFCSLTAFEVRTLYDIAHCTE